MLVSCTVNGKTRQLEKDGGLDLSLAPVCRRRPKWTRSRTATRAVPLLQPRPSPLATRAPQCTRPPDRPGSSSSKTRCRGRMSFDFGDANPLARIGVAFVAQSERQRQFGIARIGMISTQIAIEAGSALNRAGGPLIESDPVRKRPVVISRSRWLSVSLETTAHRRRTHLGGFERVAEPFGGQGV